MKSPRPPPAELYNYRSILGCIDHLMKSPILEIIQAVCKTEFVKRERERGGF